MVGIEVGGEPPTIAPGESAAFAFQLSNWCEQQTRFPLIVSIVLATEATGVEGLPIENVDDLPPCNGPGQPANLSTTEWQPA